MKKNAYKHIVNVCKLVLTVNINIVYFCLTKSGVYSMPLIDQYLWFMITQCKKRSNLSGNSKGHRTNIYNKWSDQS